MSSKQTNKAYKMLRMLIIFIILIFIILQIILVSLKNISNEKETISETQVQVREDKQEKENAKNAETAVILEKLSNMGERDRMEYYFSTFIKAVESKEYEKAYNMLYDEYKNNYFPDLDTFEEYAKKTFPKMSTINHTNIERSGDTYVLFITISDSLSSTKSEGKEMKVVIKENNLNDFVMSFSVI